MGSRDAYASMIPCITKSIAKEGMAHQIRDFAHRYNPAQKEPRDGISARCAGVHLMQEGMSISTVLERDSSGATKPRRESVGFAACVFLFELPLIHTDRPDPFPSRPYPYSILLTHLILRQKHPELESQWFYRTSSSHHPCGCSLRRHKPWA